MNETAKCELCGEAMPKGEEMFKFHGYSGPCRKPPLLQPHQQRVVTEKAELDEKIGKLFGFITSEKFEATVPQDERHRLNFQYNVMMAYSKILELRIAAFAG